jgi:adenylosuccinate synthase
MSATLIIGSQWGDEGKGLISAYITARNKSKLVCRGGTGSNAEHGLFLKDGKTYLRVNQLPLGWIMNKDVNIRIGSGVALNPTQLFLEMDKYNLHNRVKVDYRCAIITPEHIESEKQSKAMLSIGSTFSGTGFCRADFILRKARQARDIPELANYLVDLGDEINDVASKHEVTIESSQGALLSLAISPDYPNVTSDNVTTCAIADDTLLSWRNIKDVILVVKALPTREGSGNMGVEEFSEQEIVDGNLIEISSIAGAIRRKAKGIDFETLRYVNKICGATQIALTFCEHYDKEITDCKNKNGITKSVWDLIKKVELETGVPVTLLNTGKAYNNIIDLQSNSVDWNKVDDIIDGYQRV